MQQKRLNKAVLGIRIRCFLTPGSGMGKKNRIRIRNEQPRLYFRELREIFWVKILKFFDASPGSGKEKIPIREPGWKIRIRDVYPGSATLK